MEMSRRQALSTLGLLGSCHSGAQGRLEAELARGSRNARVEGS